MNTTHFSGKLDTLPATLDLFATYDAGRLSAALAGGRGRHAVSIGSGGSLISAEYLARCRDSLGLGPTTVQTPMQAVLEVHELAGSEVWLFSAGGDNPDAVAAVRAVMDRACSELHLVTRNPEGAAARMVETRGGTVHLVPVTDIKDGYLATHSMLSTVTALLIASDLAAPEPRGTVALLEALTARIIAVLDPATRSAAATLLVDMRRSDTVIVVADPLIRPLSVLLDTSLWEASLCAVQTTDFRNLAHGRHAWLHHRGADTYVIALVGIDSEIVWSAIESILPSGLRRRTIAHGACGRLENALALLDGLGIVEAMGVALGIDPGKPGIGEFGRSMYEDQSLLRLSEQISGRVRHKRAAIARSDAFDPAVGSLAAIGHARLKLLADTAIGGAVFDYDGTIVTTEGRYHPPEKTIVEELVRLHAAGLRIGIATGRGGSAGEEFRKLLAPEILSSILIGYYNGGYVRTADVDITAHPPAPNPEVAETAAWLRKRRDLLKRDFKEKEVQLTIDHEALHHPYRFRSDLRECPAVADGRVRVLSSGHSYDVVPASSSKLAVADAIRSGLRPGVEVLCFGDSGSALGNDHVLLSHPFGISVGEACGSATGCWSLFGTRPAGPAAVLSVLRALVPSGSETFYLDVASLGLDSP